MKSTYGQLTLVLALLAAVTIGLGVVFLGRSSTADLDTEIGKWLLTLSVGLAVTGALSMLVKRIDQRRSDREAWHAVLNDLVTANQTVVLARVRLKAHRSAKTYQEQLGELMAARVELRRLSATGIDMDDRVLRDCIQAMRRYLDEVGREYERGYLYVARQQRLDEIWLTEALKAASGGNDRPPPLPDRLAKPGTAWELLLDARQFPRLAALLDDDAFAVDAFRTSYKVAKGRLEKHAGFGSPPTKARMASGQKLSQRTRAFLMAHREALEELHHRTESVLAELDRACEKADTQGIDDATLKVNKAAAIAVDTVYPSSDRGPTPTGPEVALMPAARD